MLVVISIIVILALIIIWFLRTQIFKGNDGKRKGDIHKIQVAVEEYEKDNDCYPPSLIDCRIYTKDQSPDFEAYISKFPCDPVTNSGYVYLADPSSPSCPAWYWIFANLGNEADPDIEELGCTYGCGPELAFNYYVSSPNAPDPEKGTGDEGGGIPQDFYGCFSGSCLPINWDPARPGPECDPNYGGSTCYDQCTDPETGTPQNECQSWQ